MIYKFRFEIYTEDNKTLLDGFGEESGRFWWAFTEFILIVMNYVKKHQIHRDE